MSKPDQGGVELLDDPAAQALLQSRQPAHLAYTWTDGTPRCTPIWFHWDGNQVVMAGPANAPKGRALADGLPVAVTIDSDEWPYQVLMIRGQVRIDQVEGVAPEYRAAATRYFGEEQGNGWCDQLPADMVMTRFSVRPEWVGLLDFDGMRRLPSAIAG